ncbi:MAG: GNAT family N-acetyltransferase [Acidimicrobiales bacterium]
MNLRLRPYSADDEAAARRAHELSEAEGTMFLLGMKPEMSWSEFLESVETQRQGLYPSQYRVRAVQLAATVDGQLVGRASIRFELNEFFATEGGHIGYVVLPEFRRRGFATEILRQALVIARAGGVDPVLIYCSDANVGSYTAIERCGGVLDEVIANDRGEPSWRRYWIN